MGSIRIEDKFTVHVISSALMKIFDQNTLASFSSFFNDEIQLSDNWRVALSEIIFPTEVQHVVNSDLTAYSLKGYEYSQRTSSDANVNSRPYSGKKSFSRLETLTLLVNFDLLSSEQLYYPIFRFVSRTGNYEILFL